MTTRQFDREGIEPLLAAQERQVSDVTRAARVAERGIARRSYAPYRRFRVKLDEYDALSALVDNRLETVADDPAFADLRVRQGAATARVLSTLVRASIRFLYVMQEAHLPLGAREILVAELRTLEVARHLMAEEAHRAHLDERALADLGTAERIIQEVMKRAPSLIEFQRPSR